MGRLNANKRRMDIAKKYTINNHHEPGKGLIIKGVSQQEDQYYVDDSKAIIYHYNQYKQVNQKLQNLESKRDTILEKYLLHYIYKRMARMRHKAKTHQLYKSEQLQDLIDLFGSKEEAYAFRKKYLSYKL